MNRKIFILVIIGMLFLCKSGIYSVIVEKYNNIYNLKQSSLEREEMYPIDSLRYKFL